MEYKVEKKSSIIKIEQNLKCVEKYPTIKKKTI